LCSSCVDRVDHTCPLCRRSFTDPVGDVGPSGLWPYLRATCKHCKQPVPLENTEGYKHFCLPRRQAHLQLKKVEALANGPAVLSATSVSELTVLQDSGYDLFATDRGGRTVLHLMCQQHRYDVVAFLRHHGLSLFQPCGMGMTPIDYALYGARSDSMLAFVQSLLREHPTFRFHELSFILAAQRGQTVALDFLCRCLVELDIRRGPLLKRMFNEGMAGAAPMATMNVLRRWFSRIDEVVLQGSILHGAISVFDDCLRKLHTDDTPRWWEEVVELCFRCRESSAATHRIFTHQLFDDESVKEFATSLFHDGKHFRTENVTTWARCVDVATYRMVVEQRKILRFAPDENGVTMLHLACRSRNHALVSHLLSSTLTGVLDCDSMLGSPLHCACSGCDDAIEMSPADGSDAFLTIKLLLDHCEHPRDAVLQRDQQELTPVNVADAIGLEVLQTLVPDVHHGSLSRDGRNCLHALAARTNADALAQVLDALRGAIDVDLPCENGYRPIHHAAFHGNARHVDLLANCGASLVDENGQSVLHHAAAGGAADLCRQLLAQFRNLDPQDRDSFGQSAFDVAVDDTVRESLCTFS